MAEREAIPDLAAPGRLEMPTDPIAPAGLRVRHRELLLRLIWERREVSRADLARVSGMARSSISAIVADLLETGLVHETRAGVSSGGRRPIMLGFDDNARCVLGFEVGASHISGVLTDLRGRVLGTREEPFDTRTEPRETVRRIVELARDLRGEQARPGLLGVGIALPSPIDPETGGPLPSVLPNWEGYDAQSELQSALDVPVKIDNDANAGALAELWWGEAGPRPLVYVKVATGIGAGLVLNGQIHRGRHGVAGELGHLSIDPNGPPCVCGANGCLNVIIGTPALLERARARRPHFPQTLLPAKELSVHDLVDAAKQDDPLAKEIVAFAGQRLGEGLANLLNILDPGTIIIGGRLADSGERLLEPVRETIRRRTALTAVGGARIVQSRMVQPGIAIGAATLILEAALKTNEIPLLAVNEPGGHS